MNAITSISNGQPQTLRKSQRLSAQRTAGQWKTGSLSPVPVFAFQSPEQRLGSMNAITSISNGQPQTLRKSQRLSAQRTACQWKTGSSPSFTLPPTQASLEEQNVPVEALSPATAFQSPEQRLGSMNAITSISNGQPQTLRKSQRLSAQRTACQRKMSSSASLTLPPMRASLEEQNVPVGSLSPASAFQSPEQQGFLVAASANISNGQPQTLRKSQRLSAQRTACQQKMGSSPSFTLPPTQASIEEQNASVGASSPATAFQSPEQHHGSMDAITSISNGQPQTLCKPQRLSAQRTACQQKMGSSPSLTLPPTQASLEEQNVPVGAPSPASDAFQSPEQRLGSMDAITSTSNGQPQTLRKSQRFSAQRTACQRKMNSSPLLTLPPTQAIEEQNIPVGAPSPASAFQSPEQQGLLVAASANLGSGQRQQLRRSPRLAATRGHHQGKIDSAAIIGHMHTPLHGENHDVLQPVGTSTYHPAHQEDQSCPEELPSPAAAASSMATQDPGMEEKIEQVLP